MRTQLRNFTLRIKVSFREERRGGGGGGGEEELEPGGEEGGGTRGMLESDGRQNVRTISTKGGRGMQD